jgi:hypothetical protein
MEDYKKLDRLEYQRDKLNTYIQQMENDWSAGNKIKVILNPIRKQEYQKFYDL